MGVSSASSANAIAIGNTNTASGTSGATAIGGYSNTASGQRSFVLVLFLSSRLYGFRY